MAPTHFVAIRVRDEGVLERFEEFLEHMKTVDRSLSYSFCRLSRSHVTLAVLNCPREREEELSQNFMRVMSHHYQEHFRGQPLLRLKFEGLGRRTLWNGHQLIYAKVSAGIGQERLRALIQDLRRTLNAIEGVDVKHVEEEPFLHTSLINTKIGGNKENIDPNALHPHADTVFGEQVLYDVQLLDLRKKGEDGYYKVEATQTMA